MRRMTLHKHTVRSDMKLPWGTWRDEGADINVIHRGSTSQTGLDAAAVRTVVAPSQVTAVWHQSELHLTRLVVLNMWLIGDDEKVRVKKPAEESTLLLIHRSCNTALMDRVQSDSKQLHHFLHNDSHPLFLASDYSSHNASPSRLFT